MLQAGGQFAYPTDVTMEPLTIIKGNILVCHTPRELLFNDVVSDAEALSYVNRLQPQPSKNWNDTVNYAGWKEVPCSYLVCEVFWPVSKPSRTLLIMLL